MLFGVLGGALTILIGFSVFFTDQGGLPGTLRRDAYPAFAAVFSVAMAVTILWSAWEPRRDSPTEGRSSPGDPADTAGDVSAGLPSRSSLILKAP